MHVYQKFELFLITVSTKEKYKMNVSHFHLYHISKDNSTGVIRISTDDKVIKKSLMQIYRSGYTPMFVYK